MTDSILKTNACHSSFYAAQHSIWAVVNNVGQFDVGDTRAFVDDGDFAS